MRCSRKILAALTFAAAVGMLSERVVVAQKATFDIEGLVADAQKAVLPGAGVTAHNLATGLTRTVTTDAGGRYVIPALPSEGKYEIKVEMPGFATELRADQSFTAGQRATVNFELKLSTVRETVTVTGQSAIVDTTSAKESSMITQQTLESLPVKERNVFRLMGLNSNLYNQPNSNAVYSGGGDVWSVGTYVDGTDNFSKWMTLQRGPQRGSGGYALETIKEIQLITNQYSAEFGGHSGGLISAVTKSGTNDVRGSGFVSIRPGDWDSKPPLATIRAPYNQQQFGGTLGGPIIHDKMFYFGSYEQRRQRSSVVVTSPLAPGTLVPTPADEYQSHGRVDFHLTDKSTLALRANVVRWSQITESGGLSLPGTGFNWDNPVTTTHMQYNTVLSNQTLNEVRAQFSRYRDFRVAINPVVQINRAGYAITGGDAGNANGFGVKPEDTFDLSETVSLWRGRHSMKVGGAFNYERVTQRYLPNENGIYLFSGPPSTAPNPFLFQQGFALTPDAAFMNPRDTMLSGYFQDDVKVKRNLTLNLGVRYDIEFIRNTPGYNAPTDKGNVDPRLGVAWDVAGDQKWVFRGGVGRFTQQELMFTIVRGGLFGPNGLVSLSLPPTDPSFPVFPNALPAFPPGAVLPARNIQEISNDLKNEHSIQVTAGLQHSLGPKTVVSVDYTNVNGWKQGFLDVNAPTSNPAGNVRTVAQADATRPITPVPNGFRQVAMLSNVGRSWYDGVRFAIDHRAGRLNLMANYTYANSQDMLNHWTVPPDSSDPFLDKGPSTADIRHNFVASAAWTMPFQNVVLRDWNASGVVTARSGLPYNITYGTDANGTGQGDARPGGRNSGRQGSYKTLDFSLTRILPMNAKHKLEIRAMAFNALNNQNYTSYIGQLSAGARFGQPTSGNPGRQFQFDLAYRF